MLLPSQRYLYVRGKVPGSSGTAESVLPIMSKIGGKRRKSVFGAAFVRNHSNRVPSRVPNLILTFRIEWRCPFVSPILRCRDIGSESEFGVSKIADSTRSEIEFGKDAEQKLFTMVSSTNPAQIPACTLILKIRSLFTMVLLWYNNMKFSK